MRGIRFFRGVYIWIPTMLIIYALIFFCFTASADDEFYFYGVIKTNLIKVSDIDGDRIIPDVPFMLYSYYAVSEGSCVTYSRDLKNEGKEIMAVVAVKIKDEQALKDWVGYIGDNYNTIKQTATYATHYSYTIGDLRSYTDDEGTLIPYLGADRDDPARFAMWDK